MVKLSDKQRKLLYRFSRMHETLLKQGSADPIGEIAAHVGLARKRVEEVQQRLKGDMSIETNASGDDGEELSMHGILADDCDIEGDLVERDEAKERSEWLKAQIARFSPRDQELIRLRHVEGLTLRQAGAKLGISQERVRQIEAKRLGDLRRAVRQAPCR